MNLRAPLAIWSKLVHRNIMRHAAENEAGVGAYQLVPLASATKRTVKLSTVYAAEVGDVARVGRGLAYRRWVNALRGLWAFARCRTTEDFVAAQAAIVAEDMELMRGAYERAGEIVASSAGSAVRAARLQT
ncbi:MAG: hypothetical protein ACR2FH_02765 [Caulobacteraceae bacterium]